VDGMSKRPYTIRGTERFATSRSQGLGSAAGRAVGHRAGADQLPNIDIQSL